MYISSTLKASNKYTLLISYLALAFGFYHTSLGVYFLSDDLTQIHIMSKFGLAGVTHNFDIAFIRPLPYIFMAILHDLFGHTSAMPYHAWNIIIHALNSWLVFLLYVAWVKRYAENTGYTVVPGIIAGLLFLALPYQNEAVTWVAATVDLMVTAWTLVTILLYLKYRTEKNKRYLYGSLLAFFMALMCKEASLFIPVLIFISECIEYWPKRYYSKPFKTTLLYAAWFPLYIFMRYFFLGELIGGYHEMHTVFSPLLLVCNAGLYTAKFFAFYRLLPDGIREILKLIIHNKIILVTTALSTTIIILYFRNHFKQLFLNKSALLLFMAFYISLIPVINLETSFIGDSQSDRYGYLPAIFFLMLLTYMLNEVLNRKVLFVISACLMIWFYTGVQTIGSNWVAGSAIAEPMIKKFVPAEGTAYILNLPDNYNGTYMLRTGFADGVSLIYERELTGQIKVLSYHPIQSANDSVRVTPLGENAFEVRLLAPANRFYFIEKLFSKNPNTSLYTILEYSNTGFVVQFKKIEAGDALYYYSAGKLRVVSL
ncbi:MAG: hypothetical protein HYU69_08465 [Bacteroidetes bacterium]|nr:hypothetical protein [Bacteroidota bacterium]